VTLLIKYLRMGSAGSVIRLILPALASAFSRLIASITFGSEKYLPVSLIFRAGTILYAQALIDVGSLSESNTYDVVIKQALHKPKK
jgi:hypothetical protein